MRLDEARGLLMQALREGGWNQVGDLLRGVGLVKARSQGIDPNRQPSYSGGKQYLQPGDETLLMEVIWSLIVQGILVPGMNDANPNLPFLRLTEYGNRCIDEDRLLPHDPDGYLREFNQAVPTADSTILEYLVESLQCYIHGLNKASAVMLGAASEQATLALISSYSQSIGDVRLKERFNSEIEKASSLFRKYGIFEQRFSGIRGSMPKELVQNIDSQIRGIFDLIRNSRNDAGHPASGAEIDRDSVYSHLRLFIPYCKRIYGLIGWFDTNKT